MTASKPSFIVRARRRLAALVAAALVVAGALVAGPPAFAADPRPGGTSSISGAISGYDGTVSVRLYEAGTGMYVSQAGVTTSESGTAFSANSLPAGSYVLVVSSTMMSGPPAAAVANDGAPIVVAEGEAVTGVDVEIGTEPATVSGTARVPVGELGENEIVSVSINGSVVVGGVELPVRGALGSTFHTSADLVDGVLEVPFQTEVVAGTAWSLRPTAAICEATSMDPPFCSFTIHESFSAPAASSVTLGLVDAGEDLPIGTVELESDAPVATGTVEGSVADASGAPLAYIGVQLLDPATGEVVASFGGPRGLAPEAEGVYSDEVVAGEYLIRYVDYGGWGEDRRDRSATMFAPVYLEDAASGATSATITLAEPIEVVADGRITIPEVRLERGGSMRGTTSVAAPASASDPTIAGVPVPGESLQGVRPQLFFQVGDAWEPLAYSSQYFGESASEFVMSGLPGGDYCLHFAESPGINSEVRFAPAYRGAPGAEDCDEAELVSVTTGEETSGVDTILGYLEPSAAPASNDDFQEVTESTSLLDDDTFALGDTVTFAVDEELAGQWVSVFAHSEPTSFGWWVRVAADGTLAGELPAELPEGEHSLVVQNADGAVLGWQAVTVEAAPAGGPTNVVPPSFTGTPRVGETLTAVPGEWVDAEGLDFDYAWFTTEDEPLGAGATLVIEPSELGKSILVVETARAESDPVAVASSGSSTPVATGALTTGTPTISGTAKVGEVLSAAPGSGWTPGTEFSYAWFESGNATPIGTGWSLTVPASAATRTITVEVTGSLPGYADAAASSMATRTVIGVLASTASPTVSGTTSLGSTLSVSSGSWNATPSSLAYQWLADGTVLPGETGTRLVLGAAHAGKSISVRLTASLSGYTPGTAVSAGTAIPAVSTDVVTDAARLSATGGTATTGGDILVLSSGTGITASILPGTTITSSDAAWDGAIASPRVVGDVTVPAPSGQRSTVALAIEVGAAHARLVFDQAVRLVLPGQAGKSVGFIPAGGDFTPITSGCTADTQTAGDALAAGGDCAISVGSDLVVWTRHFTVFAAYSLAASGSLPVTGFESVPLLGIAVLLVLAGAAVLVVARRRFAARP